MPVLTLLIYAWTNFESMINTQRDYLMSLVFGFTPVCDEMIISATKKWLKLILWLPSWISYIFIFNLRFFLLAAYFLYVTSAQVLALISDWLVNIKY